MGKRNDKGWRVVFLKATGHWAGWYRLQPGSWVYVGVQKTKRLAEKMVREYAGQGHGCGHW